MKLRIGILTYHHVLNIGSVLQAYCTWRLLHDLFPHSDVEIIDYVPPTSRRYGWDAIVRRTGFGFNVSPRLAYQKWMFDRFLRRHCMLSPPIRDGNPSEVIAAIAEQGYNIVCVGSDTVFQLDGYFGVPIAEQPPPNPYFLRGLTSTRKIGIAISFDPFRATEVESERLQNALADLLDFDFLFYRDATAEVLLGIAGIGAKKMDFLPDPTLVVGVDHLLTKENESRYSARRAGVSVADAQLNKKISSLVRQAGFEVIDVMSPIPRGLDLLRDDAIGGALGVYRRLDLLITDRFHGSILALQLGDANLVGIEDAKSYVVPNSKLRDLYQRLGIADHLIRCSSQTIDIDALQKIIKTKEWTREQMQIRLAALRDEAWHALTSGLAALTPDLLSSESVAEDAQPSWN